MYKEGLATTLASLLGLPTREHDLQDPVWLEHTQPVETRRSREVVINNPIREFERRRSGEVVINDPYRVFERRSLLSPLNSPTKYVNPPVELDSIQCVDDAEDSEETQIRTRGDLVTFSLVVTARPGDSTARVGEEEGKERPESPCFRSDIVHRKETGRKRQKSFKKAKRKKKSSGIRPFYDLDDSMVTLEETPARRPRAPHPVALKPLPPLVLEKVLQEGLQELRRRCCSKLLAPTTSLRVVYEDWMEAFPEVGRRNIGISSRSSSSKSSNRSSS